MSVGLTTALVIGGVAAAAGGVASGVIGAHAAGKAADAQSKAAQDAAALQAKSAKEALDFQKQQYADTRKDQAPWLGAGTSAINSLSDLNKNGGFPDWTGHFQAPTDVTEQNDPGFKFRLEQGTKALERSASARGGLLSGGTGKALTQFGQDFASNEYGNVYNRALGEYQQGRDEFLLNNTNKFNRYASLAGMGQQTATTLGQQGQSAASNTGNILMDSARTQGSYLQDAATARASGYVGGANAWSQGLGGVSNFAGQLPSYILMSQLLKGGGPSFGPGGVHP